MIVEVTIDQKFLMLGEAVITSTVQSAASVALENLLFKTQDSQQFMAVNHGHLLPTNAPPISEDLRAAAQTKGETDVK